MGKTAITIGEAVAVIAEISASDRGAPFVLAGSTAFEDNITSEIYGGALGFIGGVIIQLETSEIIFSDNHAVKAVGAIHMWGNDLGPHSIGLSFSSNFARHDGVVYFTGRGNALIGLDSEQRSNLWCLLGAVLFTTRRSRRVVRLIALPAKAW